MPTVSIIIPTYNRQKYITESILSILNQDYTDFEIIVSDNASSDNTEEAVKSISDKRIHYYRNTENIGVAKNHNRALELCNGKYVQFFSDDDIMLDGCLRNNVDILDTYSNVGLVHSDIYIIGSSGEIISNTHWADSVWKKWSTIHSKSRLFLKKEYHGYLYKIHNLICMPSVMIRKDSISTIGYMDLDLKLTIDWDFWLKLTLFYDVYYTNRKLVSYRVHSNSITNNMKSDDLKQEIEFIKNRLEKKFPDKVLIKRNKFDDLLQNSRFYSDYSYYRVLRILLKKILINK